MSSSQTPNGRPVGSRAWRWLFVLPMVALLWVPFYNRLEPTLWGVPFFYWYQFAWVFITSALTLFVLRQERG